MEEDTCSVCGGTIPAEDSDRYLWGPEDGEEDGYCPGAITEDGYCGVFAVPPEEIEEE